MVKSVGLGIYAAAYDDVVTGRRGRARYIAGGVLRQVVHLAGSDGAAFVAMYDHHFTFERRGELMRVHMFNAGFDDTFLVYRRCDA
jgi:hypothetical protein